MLYVRDKGRMCNNILQFGHAYAWAREHGLKAVSMRFCYKYPGFAIAHTRGHNPLTYLWAKGAAAARLLPVVSYDSPEETPGSLAAKDERLLASARGMGAVAQGWWLRHYDLFLKYRDEITALFAFHPSHPQALPRESADEVWLALHMRRGDYTRWHDGRYFFTDGQYAAAVRRLASLLPEGRRLCVAVFTNDPDPDCKGLRERIGAAAERVVFPCGSAVGDLEMMSQCDYIIGPPSTYSLVAAMYRDLPLYWIEEPEKEFTLGDFGRFETLFRYEY